VIRNCGAKLKESTHFLTFSITLTSLLDKINVYPTTLYEFNFQSVVPQEFKSIGE